MRRAARLGRVGAGWIVGAALLVVAAAPAGAAAKPNACLVVTPAAVAAATGQPKPPPGARVGLDRGRGSQCEYELNGGRIDGEPTGIDLNAYWSPHRSGRAFIAGTARNIASDTGPLRVVPDGVGDVARIGGKPGFRQLLVREGSARSFWMCRWRRAAR